MIATVRHCLMENETNEGDHPPLYFDTHATFRERSLDNWTWNVHVFIYFWSGESFFIALKGKVFKDFNASFYKTTSLALTSK